LIDNQASEISKR